MNTNYTWNGDRFNPKEFEYQSNLPIDNSFWIEINDPSFLSSKLYIPKNALNKNWPDKLMNEYEIEKFAFYDPEIVALPLRVTKEMIEEANSERLQYPKLINARTGKSMPLPPIRDAVEFIEHLKISSFAKLAVERIRNPDARTALSDFKIKATKWNPDYGFLVSFRDAKGWPFPRARDINDKKYEVVREFFFHVPEGFNSGIILSVAQEPNTNRAIWGFRRDFLTDWPSQFSEPFSDEMSRLIRGLESVLI